VHVVPENDRVLLPAVSTSGDPRDRIVRNWFGQVLAWLFARVI
jgi:hypothetical protein